MNFSNNALITIFFVNSDSGENSIFPLEIYNLAKSYLTYNLEIRLPTKKASDNTIPAFHHTPSALNVTLKNTG
ncbi:predicted protein [Sclerotinia sclerotiorum 1980 UF-70]|uniref:Uncharacterized protein n=1 Tax=Sclerotinia sclerotiorum (strain ATCC 18683 / 1980 / Ss-1) TaxID=665079 RepID=A7EXG5_SCLS1|nr:predicted protein [Sclerotinia sclerotiorum 1980 UF-70]EDN94157.1 predicted protein [Sclerotinia sclerotiorum 1980 UF-70]